MSRMTTEYRRKMVNTNLTRAKMRTNLEIFREEMIKNQRNSTRS